MIRESIPFFMDRKGYFDQCPLFLRRIATASDKKGYLRCQIHLYIMNL